MLLQGDVKMKNAKNVFETIAGKVAGVFARAKDSQWYDTNAVTGKFVGELVQELSAQGFGLRNSAPFTRRGDGVKVSGVSGTYTRQTGNFSWEELKVYAGGNQPASSKLMVYFGIDANTGSRRYFGFPVPRIGVALANNEWSHTSMTTDIFGPYGRPPSSQYVPGISAKEALARAGLKGLEAKV